MAALLGAIAFDATTERTQRFTQDAIMDAKKLAFVVEFFTGFYSQRPNARSVRDTEVAYYRTLFTRRTAATNLGSGQNA